MPTNNTDLITKAKELIREEVTTIAYDTWLKDLSLLEIDDNQITLCTKNSFQKEFLDGKYNDLIANTFRYLTNINRKIVIVSQDSLPKKEEKNTNLNLNQINDFQYKNNSLNPFYTFDTFIVGENNSFANAAALGVVESPGKAYNPLFIYGGVGLGKTHLMHAIGNEILKNNKNIKVLYVTSEKFTNEFINSIKEQKNEFFRNKYRNIDILMIDDIQFISRKEGVQEEFFHTFNTLHESGSQIILSSDKPPKEIPFLEERLKSRFEWGLIVDISSPDFETRVAILRKKAELKNIIIDTEILYNIATQIDSNIRELEGVLNKIIALSSLTVGPISMETAERAINDIILKKETIISNEYIQEVVSNYFNIEKRDLKSSKRSNDIAYPRQIAMYLCRSVANSSLKQIGYDFGKRDHTTVMHAVKKIEADLKENKNTRLIVDSVKKVILNK
ncbi:MAG: chromosomal replication initiator protein DnaA [Oscillospiraceae bacterium]|nr:chromosomal replication initiator protein DnaA [Oscillospiraceae bacterium]